MALSGDYHTHTKYSRRGHGKGTIEEQVKAAVDKGLAQVAITDHGFNQVLYGIRRSDIPKLRAEINEVKERYPIEVLLGVEANLISARGDIDVVEDERNIKVNNLLTNKKVIEGILSLKSDDMIYCYFVNSSSYYEIVELKTENRTILSLDDYNEIYNRQGTLGIVISPIMFVIMFGIAVKALWHMQKERTTI